MAPRGGGPAAPAPPVGPDSAVNLANLRAPLPPKATATDYAAGRDDEDDALVVHTRREDSTEGVDRADVGGLTEELALEAAAKSSKGAVEDAGWAATPLAGASRATAPGQAIPHRRVDAAAAAAASAAAPASAKQALGDRAPAPTPVPVTRSSRSAPAHHSAGVNLWVMAVVGLFAFGAVMFMMLVLLLAVGG
jgi:hypothetical protein